MRIVGGELRGRRLAEPRSQRIRPTTDRTRESLFNILAHGFPDLWEGARVLDIFAGTGALGIEALSRGAAFALFMENSVEGRGLLRSNIEAFALTGRTKVFRRDATNPGPAGSIAPFDFVFADPPYGLQLGERALAALAHGGWLRSGAHAVLEERRGCLPATVDEFAQIDERSFGETVIGFYRFDDKRAG